MVATTINCATNEVKVYDSLFQYLDRDLVQLVEALFRCGGIDPQIKIFNVASRQESKIAEYLQLLSPLQLPMD